MTLEVYSHYSFPTKWGDEPGTIPVYVDEWITKADKRGVAILAEPRCIYPNLYEYVANHYNDFRYVFTHDEELLKLPNAKLLLYGTYNIESQQEKTKGISMICSKKELCGGHIARKGVALALKGMIDTFGEFDGGAWVDDLGEIYNPYRFNVAMENYRGGYYFTEKICNCFATMTVPIYYGSPYIGEYFNPDGIIQARTPYEVIELTEKLLKNDLKAEYEKRKGAIVQNYKRVAKYRDYKQLLFENYGDMLREDFKS